MLDVSMNNLQFAYDKELVLSGVDYQAKAGKFVCFLGLSGCGKSTLLRLIGGLEKSDPKQLLVGGKPVSGPSLDRPMVFQDYGLFPWMTAGENICIALKLPNAWQQPMKICKMFWVMLICKHCIPRF